MCEKEKRRERNRENDKERKGREGEKCMYCVAVIMHSCIWSRYFQKSFSNVFATFFALRLFGTSFKTTVVILLLFSITNSERNYQ